jgi:hypothetical protein
MKYFAEYYHRTYNKDGIENVKELTPAIGSESVYPLDGRLSMTNMKKVANTFGKNRGRDFFRIVRGERFTSHNYQTGFIEII